MRDRAAERATPRRTVIPRLARIAAIVAASALAATALIGIGTAQTSAVQASERTIKAAFLFKFAEYVDWPAAPVPAVDSPFGVAPVEPADSPFVFGVLGSGALADDLLRMTADRTMDERPIRVRRLAAGDGIDDLQVLFIAADQEDKVGELLSSARGRPILTVTESEGALANGSVINFTLDGERVRFEVSLSAAEVNSLRLNSRLLAVAERVYQSP
jgi:uncharacterized protein DUF4154